MTDTSTAGLAWKERTRGRVRPSISPEICFHIVRYAKRVNLFPFTRFRFDSSHLLPGG
jgi:hypothetical protein